MESECPSSVTPMSLEAPTGILRREGEEGSIKDFRDDPRQAEINTCCPSAETEGATCRAELLVSHARVLTGGCRSPRATYATAPR